MTKKTVRMSKLASSEMMKSNALYDVPKIIKDVRHLAKHVVNSRILWVMETLE
jgi:hypothetical protein